MVPFWLAMVVVTTLYSRDYRATPHFIIIKIIIRACKEKKNTHCFQRAPAMMIIEPRSILKEFIKKKKYTHTVLFYMCALYCIKVVGVPVENTFYIRFFSLDYPLFCSLSLTLSLLKKKKKKWRPFQYWINIEWS